MPQAAWIDLGYVARTHGVRGTLWVHWHDADTPLTPFPKSLRLQSPGHPPVAHEVRAHRRHKGGTLVDLVHVTTMDAAQALKGAAVAVAEHELPKEAPGEVYLYRLMGALCRSEDGGTLGTLKNIYDHGATILLGIEPAWDQAAQAATAAAAADGKVPAPAADELLVPLFDDTLRRRIAATASAPQTIVLRLITEDATP